MSLLILSSCVSVWSPIYDHGLKRILSLHITYSTVNSRFACQPKLVFCKLFSLSCWCWEAYVWHLKWNVARTCCSNMPRALQRWLVLSSIWLAFLQCFRWKECAKDMQLELFASVMPFPLNSRGVLRVIFLQSTAYWVLGVCIAEYWVQVFTKFKKIICSACEPQVENCCFILLYF